MINRRLVSVSFSVAMIVSALSGIAGFAGTVESKATAEPPDVKCLDPHACCEESKRVLEVLQKLVAAYSVGDLKTYETYLDDNCTVFEEGSKKMLVGKPKILEELKHKFAEHGPGGKQPLLSFTIDQPFAKITNDTCVVTFVAHKEVGGANPHKEKCNVTDVFVKRGDNWKKLHWAGQWQTVTDI